MPEPFAADARPPRARAALVRIGGLVALIAIGLLIAYRMGWFDYRHTLEDVESFRRSHSTLAFTVGFVAIFGIGTAFGIPGMPFTVAAGALFGTLAGGVIAWTAAMLSAVTGYWIARTVGRDVVTRWLARFRRIDGAVMAAQNFSGILRLRLFPVLPMGMVSFVGGVARAPFTGYMAATAIGLVPSTLIYTYFADSLLQQVGSGHTTALGSVIIASLLLIGITLAPRLLRSR